MARTSPIFNNFTGGERSPKTIGRTDTKAYFSSCKELKNMWVSTQGGVEKRPGFKYIAPITIPSGEGGVFEYLKIKEFKFSSYYDQNFILAFFDTHVQFFTEGGVVLDEYGQPYTITSPYWYWHIDKIRTAQNLDEIIITCPYVEPQRLIRYADDVWEFEALPKFNGPWQDDNDDPYLTVSGTSTSGSITLTFVEPIEEPWQYEDSYLRIRGDKRFSATISGADQWTEGIYLDAGDKAVVSLGGEWVATAILQKSYDGGESWVDYLGFTSNTSREIIEIEDNIYYRLGVPTADKYTSGPVEATISKRDIVGKVLITSATSDTVLEGEVIEELPNAPGLYKWAFYEFNYTRGYPQACAFFEGRLILGGSLMKKQTVWASAVDDYFNFDTGGSEDSDPYTYTLYSNDINNIEWMVGTDVLKIGTAGGEWKFGRRDEPTTPTNVETKQHSSNGSANIQGVAVDNYVMFAQRGATKLRAMYYDYTTDRYISPELSVVAEHLARKGIKDIKFSNNPDPIVWFTTDEGTLVGCTYNTEQNIVAFHEHITDGKFIAIGVIPGEDRDEVWAVVKRNEVEYEWGGSYANYYMEQMTTQFWEDIEDAIYVDSAITATTTGPEGMTSVAGLSHLMGRTVKVITDGSVHPDCVVGEGGIDLNWSAFKVHVGLPYDAIMETMPLEPGVEGGSSAGHKKKGFRISMGIFRTNHVKVGTTDADLDVVPFRSSADLMNRAVPIFTGVKKVWLNKGASDEFGLRAVSDVPLPFALTYISPVVYSSPA